MTKEKKRETTGDSVKKMGSIYSAPPEKFNISSDIRNDNGSVDGLVASFEERIARGLHPIRLPIEVTRRDDGLLDIIAGRRRFRAAVRLNIKDIPFVYADKKRSLSDIEKLEHEISENTARRNLGPIEEARAIVKLLAKKISDHSVIKDLVVKKPNPTDEDRVISYLIKMTTYLGHDRSEWEAERLNNPTFDEILNTMNTIGKDNWAAYTQRIIYFLNYPEPLQGLMNRRIISGKAAQRIKKIKDPTLIEEISKEIESSITKNRSASSRTRVAEEKIVSDSINKIVTEKSLMRKINEVGRSHEKSEAKLKTKEGKNIRRNKYGWWYNSEPESIVVDSPYRDNFDSVLWDINEVRNDMFIAPQIYDRLLMFNTKVGDNVVFLNALDTSPLDVAIKRGRIAKIVSPEAYSQQVSRYPLDRLTKAGYNELNRFSRPVLKNEKSKPYEEYGFEDQSVSLVVVVIYPWGEINIPESLNWEDAIGEPTGQKSESLFTAQVGDIVKEAIRVGVKVAFICRNSISTKGKNSKGTYCSIPSKIQQVLGNHVVSTNFFRADKKKIWSVIIADSPLGLDMR